MTVRLPDPFTVANQEAEKIAANGRATLEAGINRVLIDCPFVDRESLLVGLEAFHKERMLRVPSPTIYPESPVWVEHILAVDRELKRLAGLSDREMALLRSLNPYLSFRGFATARPVLAEKCRVAYLPESEVGQIHIKNVDDPATSWKSVKGPPEAMPKNDRLVDDGTGSGLHIDDEPDDIFPLNARAMLKHYADDVPGAVEFYTRYKNFWSGCNVVIHDKQKRSVAIEKCSVNFIEVFKPDTDGVSHCSGMVCRDPSSPQGRYQREKRRQYLEKFGQPDDGPDQAFWDACDWAEHKLVAGLKTLGKPAKLDRLLALFRTPWPDGLCKNAPQLHPRQTVDEYTLVIQVCLLDKQEFIRWQRDPKTLEMPTDPETYQF